MAYRFLRASSPGPPPRQFRIQDQLVCLGPSSWAPSDSQLAEGPGHPSPGSPRPECPPPAQGKPSFQLRGLRAGSYMELLICFCLFLLCQPLPSTLASGDKERASRGLAPQPSTKAWRTLLINLRQTAQGCQTHLRERVCGVGDREGFPVNLEEKELILAQQCHQLAVQSFTHLPQPCGPHFPLLAGEEGLLLG